MWEVERGRGIEYGKGLLPEPQDNVNFFKVCLGDSSVSVFPKAGYIALDGTIKLAAFPNAKLIWFRRMEFGLSTHDVNHFRPDCLWYGVGLQSGDSRIGYRLFADGRIEQASIN